MPELVRPLVVATASVVCISACDLGDKLHPDLRPRADQVIHYQVYGNVRCPVFVGEYKNDKGKRFGDECVGERARKELCEQAKACVEDKPDKAKGGLKRSPLLGGE